MLKNLILVTAGLVVAGAIPKARRGQTVGEMLTEKPRRTSSRATPHG